jgi:membrane-associated phospholipid phosphatase
MSRFQIVWLVPLTLILSVSAACAQTPSSMGDELVSDFKYIANNGADDAIDVATAPLHLDQAVPLLTSPRFYLVLGTAGALWGGSYALDQTLKSHLRAMSSSDASLLQDLSYGSVIGATAVLYGWGLYSGDARAREYAITAGEGAAVATLLDIGIKAAFGRLRPGQTSSHTKFFHGGESFASGEVTPMFGLAAGISEYFDNEWYVAAPIYSLALLDGFGRMGHNEHWFSDVVGAALLGVGTTELFLYLHRRHQENPNSFKLFAVSAPPTSSHAGQTVAPTGLGVALNW